MYIFDTLKTYEKAIRYGAFIDFITMDFPKSTYYFVERMKKSAQVIQKSLANAHANWKEQDKKRYLWQARAAVQESSGLLDIASRQGFVSSHYRDVFRIQLDEIRSGIQDTIRLTTSDKKKTPVPVALSLDDRPSEN